MPQLLRKQTLEVVLTEENISNSELSRSLDSSNPHSALTAKLMKILSTLVSEKAQYEKQVNAQIIELKLYYERLLEQRIQTQRDKDSLISSLQSSLTEALERYSLLDQKYRWLQDYIMQVRIEMEKAQQRCKIGENLPTPPLRTEEEENFSNNLRVRLQFLISNNLTSKITDQVLTQVTSSFSKAKAETNPSQTPRSQIENTALEVDKLRSARTAGTITSAAKNKDIGSPPTNPEVQNCVASFKILKPKNSSEQTPLPSKTPPKGDNRFKKSVKHTYASSVPRSYQQYVKNCLKQIRALRK